MRFLSHTDLATDETPDQLEFIVHHEEGWSSYALTAILYAGFAFLAITDDKKWVLALMPVSCAFWLFTRRRKPTRNLIATTKFVITKSANGDLLAKIDSEDLCTLSYLSPEGDPSGLYANTQGKQVCLLENVDSATCEQILNRIRTKFPLLEQGDPTRTSLLHGDTSGVLTLGLSQNPPPQKT